MSEQNPIIEEMIDKFIAEYPKAEFGLAHIVLSDYNLSDAHIDWCAALLSAVLHNDFDKLSSDDIKSVAVYLADKIMLGGSFLSCRELRDEMQATYDFLYELEQIPADERD